MTQRPLFSVGCRHSRPSAVRASMCTRSGSLSKPVTDLVRGEREGSQLDKRLQSDRGQGKAKPVQVYLVKPGMWVSASYQLVSFVFLHSWLAGATYSPLRQKSSQALVNEPTFVYKIKTTTIIPVIAKQAVSKIQ